MPSGRVPKKSDILLSGQNRLVSAFPPDDQRSFLEQSVRIELHLGQVLCEAGEDLEFCYFPCRGVISIIALMSSGCGAEIGLVGTEGMVGIGALLGDAKLHQQALVQGDGEAFKIPTASLLALRDRSQAVQEVLLGFANSFMNFTAQGAACNALHKAEERLARWILLVQDRLQSDVLPITHEFIADMLGTRRATVTVVANQLENEGLIALGRREIRVLNRAGLVLASCECYGVMTRAIALL